MISLFVFFGCEPPPEGKLKKFSESRMLMGTYFKVDVCIHAKDEHRIINAFSAMWDRMEDISWRMNVYDRRSDVTKINQSFSKGNISG